MRRDGRWIGPTLVGVSVTVLCIVLVAVPTDLIDTPLFSREIPPTWWAWPGLLASSVLGGLIAATYAPTVSRPPRAERPATRSTSAAGLLTFLAVGCPVCNKLVLVAIGSAGAVTWFQPFQPLLQLVAVVLLGWALTRRLRERRQCRLPVSSTTVPDGSAPRPDRRDLSCP